MFYVFDQDGSSRFFPLMSSFCFLKRYHAISFIIIWFIAYISDEHFFRKNK